MSGPDILTFIGLAGLFNGAGFLWCARTMWKIDNRVSILEVRMSRNRSVRNEG